MPRVKITTVDGRVEEKTIRSEDEEFYDNLPFTQSNVLSTEITEG